MKESTTQALRFSTTYNSLKRQPGENSRREATLNKNFFYTLHFNDKVNVLFVEDDIFNQQLTHFILKKIGCTTEIAGNGLEAVELLKNNTYDLVLMDINMPVMNGMEATRIIRDRLLCDIPIIAVTASALEIDLHTYLRAGMNDMLPKPYTEKQISMVIYKWAKNLPQITTGP